MNPLQLRKQILVAESELNRAQLVSDCQTIVAGVRSVTDRARTISSYAVAAASLISVLAYFRRSSPAPAGAKHSWWRTLFKGAHLAGSLWAGFNPPPKS